MHWVLYWSDTDLVPHLCCWTVPFWTPKVLYNKYIQLNCFSSCWYGEILGVFCLSDPEDAVTPMECSKQGYFNLSRQFEEFSHTCYKTNGFMSTRQFFFFVSVLVCWVGCVVIISEELCSYLAYRILAARQWISLLHQVFTRTAFRWLVNTVLKIASPYCCRGELVENLIYCI